MLIGAIVTLFSHQVVFSPTSFSQVNKIIRLRVFKGGDYSVFNRRERVRCWMIRASSVGSRHMTFVFPFC